MGPLPCAGSVHLGGRRRREARVELRGARDPRITGHPTYDECRARGSLPRKFGSGGRSVRALDLATRGYRTWATRGACGRPASDLPKAAALVNPTWLLQPRSPRRDAGADGPVLDFRFDSPELRERQRRSGGRSGDKGAVRSRPRETSAARSKQRSRCPVLTPLKLPGVRESGSLSGLYLDAVLFWFGTRVSLSVGWSPGVSSVARFCPRPLGVRSHRLHAQPCLSSQGAAPASAAFQARPGARFRRTANPARPQPRSRRSRAQFWCRAVPYRSGPVGAFAGRGVDRRGPPHSVPRWQALRRDRHGP